MTFKKSKNQNRLEIIYLSAADLVKLPGNPRRDVDPKAIERLAKLIKAHGFQNPLQVFRENGKHTIIAGNHRFDAGLSLGMKEFPCIIYEGDKKAALARAISDNASNAWTEWDMPLLKDLILFVDDGSFDMDLIGFNSHELELMMTAEFQGEPVDAEPQIDRAEELNKTWKVKPGDLFQIGDHRLLVGDSTKAEDVARVMGGEKADMVFTDPPYGMNLDTDYKNWGAEKGHSKGIGGNDRRVLTHPKVIGDDQEFDPSFIFNFFNYCKEMFLFGADYYCQKIPSGGSWIVWDKTGGNESLDKTGFNSKFELCWSKSPHRREIVRATWMGVVGMVKKDDVERMHPTQKSVKVCSKIISNIKADIIVDLFLGSGTTMVACQNLNRKCRGIEISPDYCAVILQRMTDAFPGIEIKRIEKE